MPEYPVKTANGENVIIPVKTYEELLAAQAMLEALEACGVDNWDGYEDAQEMMED